MAITRIGYADTSGYVNKIDVSLSGVKGYTDGNTLYLMDIYDYLRLFLSDFIRESYREVVSQNQAERIIYQYAPHCTSRHMCDEQGVDYFTNAAKEVLTAYGKGGSRFLHYDFDTIIKKTISQYLHLRSYFWRMKRKAESIKVGQECVYHNLANSWPYGPPPIKVQVTRPGERASSSDDFFAGVHVLSTDKALEDFSNKTLLLNVASLHPPK